MEKLANLEELNLNGTNFENFSALANLTKLEVVKLYETKVENISGVENLTNLKQLCFKLTTVSVDVSESKNKIPYLVVRDLLR